MKATVIIPTAGNRPDYLRDTLRSLQTQRMAQTDYEIMVVDNSDQGNINEIISQVNEPGKHGVQWIRESAPGLHNARHAGARAAKGEILVYIDDDVILPASWLDAIVSPFAEGDVGCCGGKVIAQWEAEVPPWVAQFNASYLSLLDYGDERKDLKEASIWGCNMAVRKTAFFQVGGSNVDFFSDESLIWYSGDGECGLQEKLLEAGFKIIYEPKAWVYHRIPASRLTQGYYYRRLIFTGIHQSYTRIRKWKQKRFLFLRIIAFGLLDFVKSGYQFMRSVFSKPLKIKLYSDSLRLCSRARHAFLTILSKRLREHVLRESYL